MDSVEQRVKKIVAEQLGVNEAEIKNESAFVDDLGADSLDTVELVMALEEEFETEIPDEEAEKITTVQQAIAYVSALAGKSGVGRIASFDPSNVASQIAGEVKNFDVGAYLSPKEARRMDRFIHFGIAAGVQALKDSE